jgi:hypothetical protein
MEQFNKPYIKKRRGEYMRHLLLLGKQGQDKVTRLKGTITSLSYDLYGCIQVILTPQLDKKGELPNPGWLDVSRIEITNHESVMPMPDFEKGYVAEGHKGPA